MTYKSRDEVLVNLKEILIGKKINGAYFRSSSIFFATVNDDGSFIPKDAYLRIENQWALIQKNETFPPEKTSMSQHTAWQELVQTALNLSPYKVVNVDLAQEVPHLIIYFDNGAILYISGFDSMYDSWELGYGHHVIACLPEGKLDY